MAILKKSKIGSKLMTIIVVVAVLAVGVPLVSAYEAHTVNVTARLEERYNVIKMMFPADQEDIDAAIAQGLILNQICGPGPFAGYDEPAEIPIKTCVAWDVVISFKNVHDYPISNVTVKDNFSAELGAGANATAPVDFDIKWHDRGKAKKWQDKDPFATQYKIIWYVTYNGPDPFPDPEEEPDFNPEDYNSDSLAPGEEVSLHLLVWTKLNPSGKQEYTSASPPLYTLNSGPTAKWLDPDGHQFSYDGDPLYIDAYDPTQQ